MRLKKILVTGGAGCIGVPVCLELAKRKINVVLFDLDEQIKRVKHKLNKKLIKIYPGSIMDSASLKDAVKNCDGVIHLAAFLGVKRTETYKLKCLDININGTKNVLEATNINKKIKKIVFASSSEVYGEPVNNPVSEKENTQGKTVYAISKMTGEELVKAYSVELKNYKYTILRYFNTFGPYQISQFVIPKFINLVKKNKSPIINGDGKQIRTFIYSEDTAKATVDSLLSNKTNNKTINIGNEQNKINLIELANLIIKCQKKKIKLRFIKSFKNSDRKANREINIRYCDTSLAKKLINLKPKYSLEAAIKKTIKKDCNFSYWKNDNDANYSIDGS
jgi:UDP-glucose 4-epimerase